MSVHAVSVVSVLYRSEGVVASMLRTVPLPCEVVLVDNASPDDSVAAAVRVRPDATVVRSASNDGFGAGCNKGARSASRDVLLFLNPDTELLPGAVEELARLVGRTPNAIFGPALFDGADRLRVVCRRKSMPLHEAMDLLPSLRRLLPSGLLQDLPASSAVYRSGGEVDYVQGACMAMSREFFLRLGGFDERFFLYSEEEDLCDRARALGGRCLYVPTSAVRHTWGSSTRAAATVSAKHRFRSAVLLYGKRGGRRSAFFATAVICAAVLVRFAALLPAIPLNGGRGRGLRWTAAAVAGALGGAWTAIREERSPVGLQGAQ